MEALTVTGLMLGLVSLAATVAIAVRQTSESKIDIERMSSYIQDMHAHLLVRFDRVDRMSEEIAHRLTETGHA